MDLLLKIVLLLCLNSHPLLILCDSKILVCYFPNWARYRIGMPYFLVAYYLITFSLSYWPTKLTLGSEGKGQFTVDDIDSNLCTHVLYAFAILDGVNYKIMIGDTRSDVTNKGYEKFVALKTKKPSLKVMISLGGWADSNDVNNKYAKLVASPTHITTFVASAVEFIQRHKFDGLDLHWAFPSSTADVSSGVFNLVDALRKAFIPHGCLLSAFDHIFQRQNHDGSKSI